MLRGCLWSLILLLALGVGYYYWLDQVFEPPASMIAGGVVGFLVLCCLGALRNAWTAWRDASRLSAARFDVQLQGGRIAVVSGTIHPVGEPLVAPFSKTPCVLCEYDLAGPRRVSDESDNAHSGSDFAGFLMVPCVVRAAAGEVRLLGFPIVEDFDEVRCTGHSAAANARQFLRTTEFEDRSGLKVASVLLVFGQVWSDDDGFVQRNLRLGKVSIDDLFPPDFDQATAPSAQGQRQGSQGADLRQGDIGSQQDDEDDDEESDDTQENGESLLAATLPRMTEKRVDVGEKVCAIGIYDEMRRGLVPPSGGNPPNRLLRGTADRIEARLRSKAARNLLGGTIALAVIHATILGVMWVYLRNPEVIRQRQQAAVQAVTGGNPEHLAELLRRGLDVDSRDGQGRTLLMISQHAPTSAWLIDHGANPSAVDKNGESALTVAARFGRTEIVRLLIAERAELSPRSQVTGRTPLAEASERGHDDAARLLREAGGQE